jgi:hypothetical protein
LNFADLLDHGRDVVHIAPHENAPDSIRLRDVPVSETLASDTFNFRELALIRRALAQAADLHLTVLRFECDG